jgi:tetratricopeptide (TPR) repeat protein
MKRLLACLAVLAIAAGCSSTPEGPPEDRTWKDADAAYLAGDWTAAMRGYEEWTRNHPGDDRRPTAKLRIARCHLALGRPASALPLLDEVISADPPAPLAGDARAARGMVYHLLGFPAKAEPEFVDALRVGGDDIRRDEATYFLALSKIRQGRWDDGLTDLAILLKTYPDSPWVPKARDLRATTERVFSVQAGAFSDPAGARKRADELKARGYDPAIVPDGGLHCVRVGRFATWREAKAEADALSAATGVETAIVP